MPTRLSNWNPSARPRLLRELDVSDMTMAPKPVWDMEVRARSAQWTPRRDVKVRDTMAIDPSIKLLLEDVIGLMRLTASEGHRVRARSDASGPMHLAAMRSPHLPCDGLVVRPRPMAPWAPPGTMFPAVALMIKKGVVSTPMR